MIRVEPSSLAGGSSRAQLERWIRQISRQERVAIAPVLAVAEVGLADLSAQVEARRLAAHAGGGGVFAGAAAGAGAAAPVPAADAARFPAIETFSGQSLPC